MQLKAAYVLFTLAHFAIAAPTTDSTSGLSPVNSPRGSPGGSPRGSPRGSPQGHETIRTNAGASPEPSVDTYWRLGAFRPADVPDATGAPRGYGQQAKELACNALDTCIEAGFGSIVLVGALGQNCARRYRQNQAKDRKALGISDGYGQKAKELGCNALETCFEAGVGAGLLASDVTENCLRRFGEFRYRNAVAQGKPYEPITIELAEDGLPMKAIQCCSKGAKATMDAACRCWVNHSQGFQYMVKEAEEKERQGQEGSSSGRGNGPLPESPRSPRSPGTAGSPRRG
ncbi:hypothetical protein MCOR16_004715 [Pyricularia oryzae]|nr:hypothetical protein MCOR15_007115 [Pyricularia oryzae]KAI6530190.1 hypothetical protein MCOR16_004715 [Pyricularia oryzae]